VSFSIFIVAVSHGCLGNLPKRGDVSFTLLAGTLAILHQEA
jgi:hypothetical protein